MSQPPEPPAVPPTATSEPRPLAGRRVMGVDVARGVALLAMMSVHVLPGTDPDGRVSTTYVIASGRASALFAVLAGVGLALMTGGPRRTVPPGTRAAVLTRAVLVAAIGMALVALEPPVAVILTNYGLLFAVAVPFLRARRRVLVATAIAWLVLLPPLAHLLRIGRTPGPGGQPSFADLADPLGLLERLLLTGYYPVLTWTPYVLIGLAVGRTPLGGRATALRLLVGGALLAVVARAASTALLATGGWDALVRSGPLEKVHAVLGPQQLQLRGLFGAPPTTTWWWQAVASPHSGTAFDLAQTTGSALAVIGLALLVTQRAAGWRGSAGTLGLGMLAALAAAGSTTLSLYSLHVLVMATGVGHEAPVELLVLQIAVLLPLASMWRSGGRRGPLEEAVASMSGAVRDAVAARRR